MKLGCYQKSTLGHQCSDLDDYRFADELHDLTYMFDKFNKDGIFSASDEGKIYQRKIVDAIT